MRRYWRNLVCAIRNHSAVIPHGPLVWGRRGRTQPMRCSCGFRLTDTSSRKQDVMVRTTWGRSDVAEFRNGFAEHVKRTTARA